jgi:hypothetical protein
MNGHNEDDAPESASRPRTGRGEMQGSDSMNAMAWHRNDVYRCLNSLCECEVVLVQLPRPGAGRGAWPACCYCGTPMQKVGDV